MLTLQWLLTAAAFVLAAAAFLAARRASKRLERLTETYWELRYDFGQLRARIARLDPETPPAETAPAPGGSQTTFVPLSSLKK